MYYCFPGDFAKRHLPKGEEDKLHGLPPEAQGDYVGFIKKQFDELLGNYGPIDLLWIDQYSNKYTGEHWPELLRHAKSLQPGCLVIANNSLDFAKTDIHSYEYPYRKATGAELFLPPEGNPHPAEVCDKLGHGWYWTTKETEVNQMSAKQVVEMLQLCNSRRANYLLNVGPDRSGLIPEHIVRRLHEVGSLVGAKSGGVLPE